MSRLRRVSFRRFDDLERFMSDWKNDPVGFCNFVGRAIAHLANRNMPDLYFAIGTAYFASQLICDRIECLCVDNDRIGGQRAQILKELVKVDDAVNGIIGIWGLAGRHEDVYIEVSKEDDEYCINYAGTIWTFSIPEELIHGVIVRDQGRSFYDFTETKNMADLVVLASNLMGFKC